MGWLLGHHPWEFMAAWGPSLPLRGGHPRERAGQGSDCGARSTFCNWHRLGPFEGEFAWSCPDRHCAREVTLHGSVDGSPVMGFGYLGRGAEPIASKEPGGCQPSGELKWPAKALGHHLWEFGKVTVHGRREPSQCCTTTSVSAHYQYSSESAWIWLAA